MRLNETELLATTNFREGERKQMIGSRIGLYGLEKMMQQKTFKNIPSYVHIVFGVLWKFWACPLGRLLFFVTKKRLFPTYKKKRKSGDALALFLSLPSQQKRKTS